MSGAAVNGAEPATTSGGASLAPLRPLPVGRPVVQPRQGAAPGVPLDRPASLPRSTRRRIGAPTTATDRANRVLLGLVGLVAAGAGVLALLLANAAFSWSETPGSMYRRFAGDASSTSNLSAAVAMAACLVLFLLGLRWALAQLRPVTDGPKLGTLRLGAGANGRTTVPSAAVAKAASADLSGGHGVISARVRMLAVHPVPRAIVAVEMALDARPEEVLADTSAALGRLAQALDAPTVDVDLRLRYGRDFRSGKGARVR